MSELAIFVSLRCHQLYTRNILFCFETCQFACKEKGKAMPHIYVELGKNFPRKSDKVSRFSPRTSCEHLAFRESYCISDNNADLDEYYDNAVWDASGALTCTRKRH